MNPLIISRSEHSLSRKWISPNALRVLYRLKEGGYFAYLVGGGVRDLLLGREPKDFDIATNATPGEVKKLFRNCRLIGRRFRLAHIYFHNDIVEVATFRSSTPEEPVADEPAAVPGQPAQAVVPAPSGLSAAVAPLVRPRPPRMLKTEGGMILRDNVFGTSEEDALRRDFTVNALFYNIADFSVIDYVGGMRDLRQGLIRIIGDPDVRFVEDPVRMVRAVRFAALLGFGIEENTYRALIELRDNVALASPARLYEETLKLFLKGEAGKTYDLLKKTGMFGVLFPRVNEWLDTETEGFPHIRIGKALEWVDAGIQAGRQISPSLLFALMTGQYIEEKAAAFGAAGVSPIAALEQAVAAFLGEETHRVQIPKKVGLAMRDILWNQRRFERTGGKHPLYFSKRPGFEEAFDYLRFQCELTGEKTDLLEWWKAFVKKHPPAQAEAEEGQKRERPPLKAPKRRRRRRKGASEMQKPKP
jgi:poly(A) polymerase